MNGTITLETSQFGSGFIDINRVFLSTRHDGSMEWVVLNDEQIAEYEEMQEQRKIAFKLACEQRDEKHTIEIIKGIETKFRRRINNFNLGIYKWKNKHLNRHPIAQLSYLKKQLIHYSKSNHYLMDRADFANVHLELIRAIKDKIKSLERYQINLEDLCQEVFKPSRVMYQLSLDPDYYD